MEGILPAAQDDSSGANPSSVKSDDSSPRADSRAGSPPPNCAICLGTCKNKSFTDSCLHQFCFSCLLTWSKVKAECPLCKQAFRSIIHNVRSNHQYEEYLVVQRQTEESSSRVEIDMDRVTAAAHRFRYRTTLTLPRRETIAIQQLLRHYPFMADVFPAAGGRAPPARRRRSPSSFRRTVYRHNLWARPLPDFTGRFRDCSPEFYRYNDTQMHRLVPWLNRELHYLLNENIGHISYVMSRILELLPQHHINSTEFREALQRYFGDRTEHFLHELYCFASTPYDMTGYDRNVQYTTDSRISTMVNEVISSSESEASGDSDIVMVSSSEPAEPPPGPSRFPVPAYPQSYISQPTANNSVIPIETISQSDTDDDSSEVMVVGYIKPPQERTPEIVDLLGSDSDVIVQDNPQPEPIPPSESQESRPVPSVKLTLKRHRTSEGPRDAASESDTDDSSYRPPPSRRRRRPHRVTHSAHSASTSDTTRTTPDTCRNTPDTSDAFRITPDACRTSPDACRTSPDACRTSPLAPRSPAAPLPPRVFERNSHTTTSEHTATSSSSSSSSSSSPVSSSVTTSSNSDYSDESSYSNLVIKKKSKKKSSKDVPNYTTTSRDRKKSKKKSRSRRKDKKSVKISDKDKRSKRKSHSGKGVKSSNKTRKDRSATPPEQAFALDQPSTSGIGGTSSRDRRKANKERKKRRRDSRENRRLRSVVNVMYNSQKHTDESNSSHSHLSNATGSNNRSDTESTPSTSDTRTSKSETSTGHNELPLASHGLSPRPSSDSEDNLPLNLTLQKISPSSSS